jgi:hypothetical protein
MRRSHEVGLETGHRGAVLLALLQFVRPIIQAKPVVAEVQVPPAVKQILEKSCYSCHSDERRLAWFDQIEPAYWIVRHDILAVRAHLDFSTLGLSPSAVQKAKLYETVNMIQLGSMPLPRFLALHPEAKVTPEELAILKAYLAPWGNLPNRLVNNTEGSVVPSFAPLAMIREEPNGLSFDESFHDWRIISMVEHHVDAKALARRTTFILGLAPARMP